MTRVLALCADDYAISEGVSSGIVRLARARRISALSCITNGPRWPADAARLAEVPPAVQIGLHLNFTEGRPLNPRLASRWPQLPSLPSLIVRAHAGRLPRPEIRAEVHAQLSAFIQAVGRPPQFIDGHQHVHHLPGLREIVLDVAEHLQPLPALRNTGRVLGPGFAPKRWLIERTGGRALAAALAQRVIAHNPALLGVYDFRAPDYRALMQGWLAALPAEGGLLFCHPAEAAPADPPDAIGAARARELAYLGSAAFIDDLAAAGVVLGPVWQSHGARRD